MFKNPFSFNRRIRRLEYGLSILIFSILINIFSAFATNEAGASLYFISLISLFWFLFAQGAKRCHDIGWSGWVQLIPFSGFILLFMEGNSDINKYGENPKKREKLRNKYKILIDKIVSRNPYYKVNEINDKKVELTCTGIVFILTEENHTLKINWTWQVFGSGKNHTLDWSFNENEDQNKMYELLHRDMTIQNLIDDGMTKPQAEDCLKIINCNNDEEKGKLINEFSKKYSVLWSKMIGLKN